MSHIRMELQLPKFKQILNLFGFLIVIISNALGGSSVFGSSIGDVSDKYKLLITPAGFAFSIWGLIYFLQACFVIWNLLPKQRENALLIEDISYWYFANCLVNSVWIFVFCVGTDAAVQASSFIVFLMLISTLAIILRTRSWVQVRESWAEFIVVDLAFSIYAAWLTVASILNVGIAFYAGGAVDALWGLGDVQWGIIMLSVALLINVLVVLTRKDFAFPFVLAWATNAIRAETPDSDIALTATIVSSLALALAILTVAYRLYHLYRRRRSKHSQASSNDNLQDAGKPLFKVDSKEIRLA